MQNSGCAASSKTAEVYRINPGQLYLYLFAEGADKLNFVETPNSAVGGYQNWGYTENSGNDDVFAYGWLPKGTQEECEAYQVTFNNNDAYDIELDFWCDIIDIVPSYAFTELFAIRVLSYDTSLGVPRVEAEGWSYFSVDVADSCVARDGFRYETLATTYKYYYSRHWDGVPGDNFRNVMTTDDVSNLVEGDGRLHGFPRCPKTCSVQSITDPDGQDATGYDWF